VPRCSPTRTARIWRGSLGTIDGFQSRERPAAVALATPSLAVRHRRHGSPPTQRRRRSNVTSRLIVFGHRRSQPARLPPDDNSTDPFIGRGASSITTRKDLRFLHTRSCLQNAYHRRGPRRAGNPLVERWATRFDVACFNNLMLWPRPENSARGSLRLRPAARALRGGGGGGGTRA